MQKLHTLHTYAYVPLHVSDAFAGYDRDSNLRVLVRPSERTERTERVNWPAVVVWAVGVVGGIAFWSYVISLVVEGL